MADDDPLPDGSIGSIDVCMPSGVRISTTVAEFAMERALKRLAPNQIPFPHFAGIYGLDMLRYLAEHPHIRTLLGGPDVVDSYTLNFLRPDCVLARAK